MRPGFYTRKSQGLGWLSQVAALRFNEAGILHPEKPGGAARRPGAPPRFNEAGILHPEKPCCALGPRATARCFNEAGILHPEKRQRGGLVLGAGQASMRPGFYTRKSAAMAALSVIATGLQ